MADRLPPDTGDDAAMGSDRDEGMPRWVKVSGIIVILAALVLVLVIVVGGGDGGHRPRPHGQGSEPTRPTLAHAAPDDAWSAEAGRG